jgi:dienelactone hydrolase
MLFSALLGLLSPDLAPAQTRPATRRAPAGNGWNPTWFDYRYAKPDALVVEETTPTAAQVDFRSRPPQKAAEPADLAPPAGPAKPVTIKGVDIVRLRFRDASGDVVTALLCTPAGRAGPFPVVVAVHGLGSNKAQVIGQVAPALVKRGFAVLAADMPAHGERPGEPRKLFEKKDLFGAVQRHRQAVMNVRQCIDVAERRPELDVSRGVILAGYSMGAWVNSVAGPADERVRAMVLMVGGAWDVATMRVIPQLAAADPTLAIANFVGRPLLMLNAERDATVTPEMARRLFGAAADPKEQRWYAGGHLLPERAYDDAADWVKRTWDHLPPLTGAGARSDRDAVTTPAAAG